MMSMFRAIAGGAAAFLPLALLLVSGAEAQSNQQLYEAAKGEKELLIYAGGPTAPYTKLAADFEKKFPGIKINVKGGFSNVLNEEIEKQLSAGALQVDMAFFQTAQDFIGWKKRNILLNHLVADHDKIIPAFKDPDGAYTTARVFPIAYVYNVNGVAASDAPRSALDFLKPQFQGKIITCYPADDDATLYLFHTLVQKYGWSYMEKYMANKPKFVQGHLGVARSVASGESLVSFDATATTVGATKQGGAPIELAIPADDPIVFFTLTGAIFKQAPHSNAARLFLNWYMEPEQQVATGAFSARTDVPPPPPFKPLQTYKDGLDYNAFVSNEPLVKELRARFEKITGPVVNTGGVQ